MVMRPNTDEHSWPIYVIAALLLLQSLVTLGVSIQSLSDAPFFLLDDFLSPDETEALLLTLPLAALGVLGLLAAIGFVFRLGFGWLLGMLVQGAILLYCLERYFLGPRPVFIYPAMFLSVILVLYMNSSGVRRAFPSARVFR
jgi:hypothetical protein